jgi:hypothetical protein
LVGFTRRPITVAFGREFAHQLKPLRRDIDRQTTDTRDIATGSVHAGDEAVLDRVAAGLENDRYRGGCRLCCETGCGRDACGNDSDLRANEISRQRRQPIVSTVRPPIFDRYVAALYIAGFAQTPSEWVDARMGWLCGVKIPDHGDRRLLRASRKGPRRRAAQQRDEFASSHVRPQVERPNLPHCRCEQCLVRHSKIDRPMSQLGHSRPNRPILPAAQCPLRSESDRDRAALQNVAMGPIVLKKSFPALGPIF